MKPEIRVTLRRLGNLRADHIEEGVEIERSIAKVVAEAREADVSMREAADLLGLAGRQQLYNLIERVAHRAAAG